MGRTIASVAESARDVDQRHLLASLTYAETDGRCSTHGGQETLASGYQAVTGTGREVNLVSGNGSPKLIFE
jgi:hypothetical protein